MSVYLNHPAVHTATLQLTAAGLRFEGHVSVEQLRPQNTVSGAALSASGFAHQ